jgi:hypothetical protein
MPALHAGLEVVGIDIALAGDAIDHIHGLHQRREGDGTVAHMMSGVHPVVVGRHAAIVSA